MKIDLRPYQENCINSLENHFLDHQKGLIQIPTGGGKTIVFSKYAKDNTKKTMVLSHRDELVYQAVDKANFFYNKRETGVIKRDLWQVEKKLISASVQTLASKIKSKEFKYLKSLGIDLLICDEAHHFPSPTYQEVYSELKKANPNLKLLGVTATPFRHDKKDLKEHFGSMIYSVDIKELIRTEYLTPIDAEIVTLPVSLDELKTNSGDFTDSSIAKVFNSPGINQMIVKKWIEKGQNRKTIFFTSTVEHSKDLAVMFNRQRITASHIDGKTPLKERREILKAYRADRIKIISNCGVLTEGFDDPSTECISIVRPTKSKGLYAQILGRGLRLSPLTGKKNCLILDFSGDSQKFKLNNFNVLFGIEKNVSVKKLKVWSERVNEDRQIQIVVGNSDKKVEILGEDIRDFITYIGGYAVLGCGFNNVLIVSHQQKDSELFSIKVFHKTYLIDQVNDLPLDFRDSIIVTKWTNFKDSSKLIFEKMSRGNASSQQINFLKKHGHKLGLDGDQIKSLTKLEAANLIGFVFILEAEAVRQREAEAVRQREAEAVRQREAEAVRQQEAEAVRQQEAEAVRQRETVRFSTETLDAQGNEIWKSSSEADQKAFLDGYLKKRGLTKAEFNSPRNSFYMIDLMIFIGTNGSQKKQNLERAWR